MRPAVKKQVVFIGRSMLWSLLLYVALMLLFNWDDVRNTISGKNKITVVRGAQPAGGDPAISSATISHSAGIISNVLLLVKDISGIAARIPVQY